MRRVGQNHIYGHAVYDVYMVLFAGISSEIDHIRRMHMILANLSNPHHEFKVVANKEQSCCKRWHEPRCERC